MSGYQDYVEEQNPTQVMIWFGIRDETGRRHMLEYLKANPKGLWSWHQRVQAGYQVQPEKEQRSVADWVGEEIKYVRTEEIKDGMTANGSTADTIEYEVNLIREAKDPKNLVDILRMAQVYTYADGVYQATPREWTINAWYRGGVHYDKFVWEADAGNTSLDVPAKFEDSSRSPPRAQVSSQERRGEHRSEQRNAHLSQLLIQLSTIY